MRSEAAYAVGILKIHTPVVNWTMGKNPSREAITAYLRELGNPYAKLQVLGVDDAHVDLELRDPTEAERAYARLQANQYTVLSTAIKDAEPPTAGVVTSAAASASDNNGALSKADFESECRRIFRAYIPAVEKGRLRPRHRAFISRNQSRSPFVRFQMVQRLQKYDLSSTAGIQASFNRERDELTDKKLNEIEQAVLNTTKK